MKFLSLILLLFLLPMESKSELIPVPRTWFPEISINAELNYTGYNAVLMGGYKSLKHTLIAGISWNISDSYVNKPLIGFATEYKYKLAGSGKFDHRLGIAFRNQKPLKSTSINLLSLGSYSSYRLNRRLEMNLGIGYGLVNEKYKGNNKSVDNQLGSFIQLGCVYTWQ